ncbi:type II toxin-antitoxin system SpoIISA family toxin [Rummeliibacillus stabekisii]|uniref:type II toxin-antitoxin system SpoIISA family toxin n=1 Tax=Rummeliibacillus stabekisii TaxID=241244 RepID=UPI0037177001
MGWYFILIVALLLAFILFSLFYYVYWTEKYEENLQFLRKFLYVIYLVFGGIGFLVGEFEINDWKLLLELTAVFVFIDLSIFQTPNILKIWNAEFQHSDYLKRIIKENNEAISSTANKVQKFTEIIDISADYFTEDMEPNDWDEYKKELTKYLNKYTDTFQFHLAMFPFDTTIDDNVLKRSIRNAFRELELCYNLAINDRTLREEMIEQLFNGQSFEVKESRTESEHSTRKIFVIGFFGAEYNVLISVSSTLVDVDGIDASHILNLTQIFEWYLII